MWIFIFLLLTNLAFADIPNTGYDAGTRGGSGTGSGTVSSGTINHFGGYNSAGTTLATVPNITYDSSGNITANSFITPASNTPSEDFSPILAGDTHYKICMSSDGDGTSNDHLYISEGSTCGSANAIDISAGGAVALRAALTLGGTLVGGSNNINTTGSISTTGSRVLKGWYTDLEITNAPTVSGVGMPTASSTTTYTNKTLIDTTNVLTQMTAITDSATPTPTGGSLRNLFDVTALGQAATFAAPSGTPAHGNILIITIKDNATARALSWNAIYTAGGVALPSTTILSKKWKGIFMYDTTNSLNKWCLIGAAQEQ